MGGQGRASRPSARVHFTPNRTQIWAGMRRKRTAPRARLHLLSVLLQTDVTGQNKVARWSWPKALAVCLHPAGLPPPGAAHPNRAEHGRSDLPWTRCPTRDENSIAGGPADIWDGDEDDASVATHRTHKRHSRSQHPSRPRGDGKQTCGMGTARHRSEIWG